MSGKMTSLKSVHIQEEVLRALHNVGLQIQSEVSRNGPGRAGHLAFSERSAGGLVQGPGWQHAVAHVPLSVGRSQVWMWSPPRPAIPQRPPRTRPARRDSRPTLLDESRVGEGSRSARGSRRSR
jgi:hypothetical protein